MSHPDDLTRSVSNPDSDEYDPDSPHYDVTADSSSPYYVGEIGSHAESGDHIREEASLVADVITQMFGIDAKDAFTQALYSASIKNERKGLDEGIEVREQGTAPKTVWENASHEQMVETLNNDADSAAVAETSEEWVRLGNELTTHQKAVADAISDSMGDWQGEGGDAAREHLAGVARWLGATAQGSVLTGRQQEIHSQTLNESQKSMADNPPVPYSAAEENARLRQATDPVSYAVMFQQSVERFHKHEAARQQAARIMTQFDDTVGSATDMPAFSPPPKLVQPTQGGNGTAAGGGGANPLSTLSNSRQGGLYEPTGPAGTLGGAVTAGAGGPGAPGGDGPGRTFAPQAVNVATAPGEQLPGGSQTYTPQETPTPAVPETRSTPQASSAPSGSYTYDPQTPPAPDVPQGGGGRHYEQLSGGIPTGSLPTGDSAGDVPSTDLGTFDSPDGGETYTSSYTPPGTTVPGGQQTPGWAGGTNGDITSRLGSGSSGFGSGGGASLHAGGGAASGSSGFGAGAVGGAVGGGAAGAAGGMRGGGGGMSTGAVKGIGETSGEGAAGRPVAGPPGHSGQSGRTGMGGMPMGGGGKKGEDDKEHRVAGYLADEENVLAPEQAIAPPVIGDWQNNKDENWK